MNTLEFAQVTVISKSPEQTPDLQNQSPMADLPKELKTLSLEEAMGIANSVCFLDESMELTLDENEAGVNTLEFAQVAVISKSRDQTQDLQTQDPMAGMPKALKTLSLEEAESVAQSVYVLDESMELPLAENETGSPPSDMARRKQKKVKRASSIVCGPKSPARLNLNQTLPARSPKSTLEDEPRRSLRTPVKPMKDELLDVIFFHDHNLEPNNPKYGDHMEKNSPVKSEGKSPNSDAGDRRLSSRPRKAPEKYDAKKIHKKLCRVRSQSVAPAGNCNKPLVSQSARKSTTMDLNFDELNLNGLSPAKRKGKPPKKSLSSPKKVTKVVLEPEKESPIKSEGKSPNYTADGNLNATLEGGRRRSMRTPVKPARFQGNFSEISPKKVTKMKLETDSDEGHMEQNSPIKSEGKSPNSNAGDRRLSSRPRKAPVKYDAKNEDKEHKKLCRARSQSVAPTGKCNKPLVSQHSARKPTRVDLNLDEDYENDLDHDYEDDLDDEYESDVDEDSESEWDEDHENSPAKRRGRLPMKTKGRAKRNLFGKQNENKAREYDDMAMDTSEPIGPLSTLEQVMLKLHTSEVPEKLICRYNECNYIRRFIHNGIKQGGESSCLYISGVPGTGKTASVLKVVEELREKVKQKKEKDFTFINVNGLELSDPKKLFCVIYNTLTNNKKNVAAGTAQQRLNEMFSCADRKRLPLVLLVDELDMLLTSRQEVVYSVFNWAATCESRVNVIAISNTLDLPERTLSARVSSRLGDNRLCFQPYTHLEIARIIEYRISNCEAVGKDAIIFGARKVASLSGDLRKALDLIRRGIEIALEECEEKGTDRNNAKLTFQHVHDAITESTESIRMDMCKAFSQQEEALFRAAVSELEKSALDDMIFYRLLDEYMSVCFSMAIKPMSSSAVYAMLMDMACAHFFVISADANGGEMNRKLKLGFSLPEALFCLRQMDLIKNNAKVSQL